MAKNKGPLVLVLDLDGIKRYLESGYKLDFITLAEWSASRIPIQAPTAFVVTRWLVGIRLPHRGIGHG